MSFDPKNADQVEDALKLVDERVQDFYLTTEYAKAWTRFENRINAYYRRPSASAPKWRSKLYFASFFIAVQAFDAQLKAAHSSDPFLFVKPVDNSTRDLEALDLAKMAHDDLNYDLYKSRFRPKLYDLFYFTEIFGTAIGREYIRSKQELKRTKKRSTDVFGIDRGTVEKESYERVEYTATDIIHPLNFAHDITKRGFLESEWASVRFELPVSELYAMKDHPNYYQPGVKEIISKIEDDSYTGFVVSQETYYSEKGNQDKARKHAIVVNEYSGPLRMKGNRNDHTLYYMLYCRQLNKVLRVSKSPFSQHPYWKMSTHQAPDGPYGIGSNDAILPINEWENFTVNQYNDYMNTALKFMYEVQPGNITGGLNMLLNGLPNGIIPLEPDTPLGQTMSNVNLNKRTIPPVEGTLKLIAEAKQEYGSSSNLRGRDQGSNSDTATGIQLLSQREDTINEAHMDSIDVGLTDAALIKLKHSAMFFNEPREAEIRDEAGNTRILPHFPYDLMGMDFSLSVKREVGDIEAGKSMAFLKLFSQLDQTLTQKGTPIPAGPYIDMIETIGTAIGVDKADKIANDLRNTMQQAIPPEIGGGPGGAPPQGAPSPKLSQVGTPNAAALA